MDQIRMNFDQRLNLLKDLISLITDLELQNPNSTIYGYVNLSNLFYDDNNRLKMKRIPNPSHARFHTMCANRKILSLREGFAILCSQIIPDSAFPTDTLRRDYNHFKSLAELDLPRERFRDLKFHWVFMDFVDKLQFVTRAHIYMGNQQNEIWGELNASGQQQLIQLGINEEELFASARQDFGFSLVFNGGNYDNTISWVITYWRNCEIHLNGMLLTYAKKQMSPEQRKQTKLHYTLSEMSSILCAMFPQLIPILWNFLFSKGIIMDLHFH